MAAIPPLGSVLVVGGCGFVGHHIVRQLLEQPAKTRPAVTVLDLRVDRNRLDGVTYIAGDITSTEQVTAALAAAKPTAVIHTASPVAVGAIPHAVFDKVNVGGTANLIRCCAAQPSVKAFVFTSSSSVAHPGPTIDVVGLDETSPPVMGSAQPEYYSHTKAVAEQIVLATNRGGEWNAEKAIEATGGGSTATVSYAGGNVVGRADMLTCAIRPAGIYGEGDVQMIPGLLTAYYSGKVRFQIGNNKNLFDFTYVGNIAHAHILAANALLATAKLPTRPLDFERVDGETFFVTNGNPWPWWDFARAVWARAGDTTPLSDVWVLPQPFMLFIATLAEFFYWVVYRGTKKPTLQRTSVRYSTMTRWYSIEKAKARLGYEPLVDVKEGIERAVDWQLEKRKREAEAEEAGKKEK